MNINTQSICQRHVIDTLQIVLRIKSLALNRVHHDYLLKIYVQQKSCAVVEHFTLANNFSIAFKVKFNLVTPQFEISIILFLNVSKNPTRRYLLCFQRGLNLIWWRLHLKYWFFLGHFINPIYHDQVIMEQLVS